MNTYCWTLGWADWELGKECDSWSYDSNKIVSGRSYRTTLFASLVNYYVKLVKKGKLVLRYRKKTDVYKGTNNGEFEVKINGDVVYSDSELDSF